MSVWEKDSAQIHCLKEVYMQGLNRRTRLDHLIRGQVESLYWCRAWIDYASSDPTMQFSWCACLEVISYGGNYCLLLWDVMNL